MTTRCFIDGEFVDAKDTYDNIDPATGQAIGPVARGGPEEVDRAVDAAVRSTAAWRRTPPAQRARLLVALAERILANKEELSRLEAEDTGKPLSQARVDAEVCARYFQFYGHAIDSYYGVSIPYRDDLLVYTRRVPYGVTAHIIAWNYPMQLVGREVAPATAVGNCAVLKPADETPRTAVRIAALAVDAGFPAGVFNVVTGLGPEAGAALASHPGVAHVGFVGSTTVGSLVASAAAQRLVPTVLEMGGKSAQIIFPDADLESAAPFVKNAILQNAGQTCSAGSRILVHADVHDELLERLVGLFRGVSIGPGLEDPDLGPLISLKQQDRVRGYVEGVRKGEVLCGAHIPEASGNGAYYAPTLIDGVDPTSPIAQEEVFGPVLVSMTFSEEEEAIELANATQYALLGAVWTKDLSRAHRVADAVEAGQVYINNYGAGGGVELPFGGFKKSGYGREKGYEALNTFCQTKTIAVQL